MMIHPSFLKLLSWLLLLLEGFCWLVAIAWGSVVLYFSIVPWLWLRVLLALLFAAVGIGALRFLPRRRLGLLVFAVLFAGVLVLWGLAQPSHDRDWARDVAVMPRAEISGDRVRLFGVRDFDYRTKDDFTERWTTRDVQLSKLQGVDFLMSYWSPQPALMAHTFLSFTFEDVPPICISIEARKEKHETYTAVTSMFKQFELIYVVGEERDIVGVRTNHRSEDVYLYHLRVTPDTARKLFLSYVKRINELAATPQFYHLLRNNCTTNIQRHTLGADHRAEFFWRVLANGLSDQLLYDKGVLDHSLPFAELKRRSQITQSARAGALDATFASRIRLTLTPLPSK